MVGRVYELSSMFPNVEKYVGGPRGTAKLTEDVKYFTEMVPFIFGIHLDFPNGNSNQNLYKYFFRIHC